MQERAGGIKDKEDRETAASLTGPFNQSHSLSLCEWGFHSTACEIFSAQMYHRFNPHMVSSIPTVEKCICSHICVGEDGRSLHVHFCMLQKTCCCRSVQSTSAVFAQTLLVLIRRIRRHITTANRPWTRHRYCLSDSTEAGLFSIF